MRHTRQSGYQLTRVILAVVLTISIESALLPVPTSAGSSGGSVVQIAAMNEPRSCHSATTLADGTVLIAGGMVRERQFLSSAELFDPNSATFTPVGRLHEPRACHAALRLYDGRVLLLGSGTTTVSAAAEIYDPAARSFASVGSMSVPRSGFTATLLRDGKVLIAGGSDYRQTWRSAEIFDPVSDTFIPAGDLTTARTNHTATLLPDGRVLIVGGQLFREQTVHESSEIYDPAARTFTAAAPLIAARHKHAAVALADGDVLVIGGADRADWRGRLDSIERYDHIIGQFIALDSMQVARFKFMDAVVLLPDGRVMIAGGSTVVETFDAAAQYGDAAEGRLDEDRFYQTAALLPDGRVLIAGGYGYDIQATDQAWLWQP